MNEIGIATKEAQRNFMMMGACRESIDADRRVCWLDDFWLAQQRAARRVSCGCCGNGCVCFMHRDVPRGQPMQKCSVHSGTGKTEVTYI